jgi:hypothetical protein
MTRAVDGGLDLERMRGLERMLDRPIREIADEIVRDWRPMREELVPYVSRMLEMQTLQEADDVEEAKHAVRYFLDHSGPWRGEVAGRIKSELRAMVKHS